MTDIQVFDPHAASASEWAEYNAFRRIRAEEDEPGEAVLSDAEFEQDARTLRPLHETRRMIARREGEIVGSIGLWFRREGTPEYDMFAPFVYVWGGVRVPWRRQGVGTALLRALHGFMHERGKTIATIGTHLPEGHAFLAAIGAVEKNRTFINRLALAGVDWDELARWQAAAIPPGSGLRWEIHAGRVPMERLAALQPQFSRLLGDVPLGSLDLPPLRFEMQTYVSWYDEMDRRGGEHFMVLLLDGTMVAGISEAHWSPRFPDRVYQELTGVARPWRGKGLAKGLKAAMLRLVRERHPEVALMSTSNAEANAPILSINRRLGFVVYRRDGSYQIGLDALGAWLAGR
jgi:GNAT superfamily N-acetyltransferase